MKKHVFYLNLLKTQAMKTMKFWLVALAMLAAAGAWGQGWMRIFGEDEPLGTTSISTWPNVVPTSDGQYLLMGLHYGPDHFVPDSAVLVKVDTNGNLVWRKTMQHLNQGWPTDIAHSTISGFVTIGSDYAAKFDENGHKLWQRYIDNGIAKAVVAAPNGGYLIAGLASNGNGDKFILKINENGNDVWLKLYEPLSNGLGFAETLLHGPQMMAG